MGLYEKFVQFICFQILTLAACVRAVDGIVDEIASLAPAFGENVAGEIARTPVVPVPAVVPPRKGCPCPGPPGFILKFG